MQTCGKTCVRSGMCVANLFSGRDRAELQMDCRCGRLEEDSLMLGVYWLDGGGLGKGVIGYMRGEKQEIYFDAEERMRKAESGVVQKCRRV
jgi:hypothetical protein